MKIIPLGTSSGQPTLERGVTSLAAFVGSASRWVMVDCGEGTQQKVMRVPQLAWSNLDAILVTHAHGDHCLGIFGVLAALSVSGRARSLTLVAPPEVREMAQTVLRCSHTHLNFPIDWSEPSDGLIVHISENLSARCIQMSHRAPSHGYLLESSKVFAKADSKAFAAAGYSEGPDLGFAIAAAKRGELSPAPGGVGFLDMSAHVGFERKSESLFVGGDNMDPARVAAAAPGALAWVHEATYLHEDWERSGAGLKWGHSSARMIGAAARKGGPGALVLTHFSPRYGEGPAGVERLREEASAAFGGHVEIACDLKPVEFEARCEPCERPVPKRSNAKP